MLLQDKTTGNLVQIIDLEALISPSHNQVPAQPQAGQETQEPESYAKEALVFPSGEDLPRCWLDANYRDQPGP